MTTADDDDFDPAVPASAHTALFDQYDAVLSDMVERARGLLAEGWHPVSATVAFAEEFQERLAHRHDDARFAALFSAALVRLAQRPTRSTHDPGP